MLGKNIKTYRVIVEDKENEWTNKSFYLDSNLTLSVRPSKTAATTTAHAPVPQASVAPIM